MKDTTAFVLVTLSLFYYVSKYKLLSIGLSTTREIVGEAVLLLLALVLFSFLAVYSESTTALSSLIVVVVGLVFDAVASKYPGRGLAASTVTVLFLLLDAAKGKNAVVSSICGVYIFGYCILLLFKYRKKGYKAVLNEGTEMTFSEDSSSMYNPYL